MKLLVESIKILTRFAKETGNRTILMVDFGFVKTGFDNVNDKKWTLFNSLFYMTVIDACSYLDEYEQVFGIKTEKKFNDRVLIVKAINKPLIKKIKEWKDLNLLRNQLLAHNLRQGKNGYFIFGVTNLDYNAPRTITDLFLLSNLIQFSTETINSEFNNELNVSNDETLKKIKPLNNILSKDDVSSITIKLLELANIEKIRQKRVYNFSEKKNMDWDKI